MDSLLEGDPVKRPNGVTFFALAGALSSISATLYGLLTILGAPPTFTTTRLWLKLLLGMGELALGAFFALMSIGLWRLREWARRAFMGWTVVGCIVSTGCLALKQFLVEIWTPEIWFVVVLLSYTGLCLWYMGQPGVKEAFHSVQARP